MAKKNEIVIEYPSRGQTYCRWEYGVYEYGVYPRNSVLAGQTSRIFLDSFETLEEAQKEYPSASFTKISGVSRINHDLGPNPPKWFSEADAGERWGDDY